MKKTIIAIFIFVILLFSFDFAFAKYWNSDCPQCGTIEETEKSRRNCDDICNNANNYKSYLGLCAKCRTEIIKEASVRSHCIIECMKNRQNDTKNIILNIDVNDNCDGYILIEGSTKKCMPEEDCNGYIQINGTEKTCVSEEACDGYILIEGSTKKCMPEKDCDGYIQINGTEKTCFPEDNCDGYILIEGSTKKCMPEEDCNGYIQINGTEKTCVSEEACDGYILIEGSTKKCVPNSNKENKEEALTTNSQKEDVYYDWQPPTAAEQALETPLIDPIDILSLFGGFFGKILSKGAEKAITEEFVYHYFKDSSGEVAESILKNGVRASTGFKHTLGYEGKVFVSKISPDKISKVNLVSYGVGNADSFVKIAVKKSDLVIPAQNIYFGEKGARIIGSKSGLYEIGKDGMKYINRETIKEFGSLAPHKANINSFTNNMIDAPRCLTGYWIVGGGATFNIHQLFLKNK